MTYQEIINNIVSLQEEGLELFNAGKSVLGKNILATHVGDYDGVQILLQGGIHAREWITVPLLVEMARNLHNTQAVTGGGIYFVFMVNPDGVQLALDGLSAVNCQITKDYLTLANGGSEDFSLFKANINLVDLNTNFNADWGNGAQNVFCPATENFVGFYPESEREVQSLINFTLQTRPLITISYHSKGNVIYYGFENQTEEHIARDYAIGEVLSSLTGYPLIFTENSTGGYKDWCINSLKIPAYTIEVGDENLSQPIGIENLPEIYNRNKDVPLVALDLAKQYANEIDFGVNEMEFKKTFKNLDKPTQKLQNICDENRNSNATSHITRLSSLFSRGSSRGCSDS